MNTSLVIRGTGMVTALGNSVRSTWDNLLAGRFITNHSRAVGVPSDDAPDRVMTLALVAARDAVIEAGWGKGEFESDRTALIVGTSKGAADQWLTAPPATFNSTSDNPTAGRAYLYGLHSIAEILAARFQFGHGPRLTISSACATGLHAAIRAAMLLRQGHADRVLIVAAESSLHPIFLQCYHRLGVVAAPGQLVRPMDQSRSGFLVSEAAAAICLERRPAQPGDVLVDRFALGSDATHLTGIDPHGQTLRRCLSMARPPGPIDLIHAHATGTHLNDPIELAAIESIAGNMPAPNLFSHKGAIGHTLGAAGLISIVLSAHMHRSSMIPPNINTTRPLPTQHVRIEGTTVYRPIKHSLCIAAGFGGATAVVGLQTA